MPKTRAALFDLDHTLFKVNSTFRFGLYLHSKGLVSHLRMLYMVGSYFQHKAGLLSFQALHQRALKSLTDLSAAQLQTLVGDWLSKEWDKMIAIPILEELQKAQAQNAFTAILSNSPEFIIRPISRKLKVDDWLATRYLSDSRGSLTLHTSIEGKDKAQYVDKLSRQMGIPYASISAYSDSINDLPFLQKVGSPIAVNPDRQLKRHCLENQWKILALE